MKKENKKVVISNDKKNIVISVACAIAILLLIVLFNILRPVSKIKVEHYEKNVNEEIKKIELKVDATNVEIKRGTEFKIEENKLYKKVKTKVKNNKIVITEKLNQKAINFITSKNESKITIYIPGDKIIDNVEINCGAGSLDIDMARINNLDIKNNGNVKINNSVIGKLILDGKTGTFDANTSTLTIMDIKNDESNINLNEVTTSYCKISRDGGKISMLLKGSRDEYTLDVEKGKGSVLIDGNQQLGYIKEVKGDKQIYIDNGAGSIDIKFMGDKDNVPKSK